MRTFFDMGFRNGFRPLLGQDYSQPLVNIDQGPPAEPVSGAVTSFDNQPSTPSTPSSSSGSGSTDWAKTIAQGITAAGAGYGAYTKEEVAKINEQTSKLRAGLNPGLPGGVQAGAGAISPNTIFLVGGLAAVGIIAAVVLR